MANQGLSAKCLFEHPAFCKKLMTHGMKGPNGCNKGKKCDMFHPKMCPTSISKAECYDDDCGFHHVKGTKRIRKTQASNKTIENQHKKHSFDKDKREGKKEKSDDKMDFLEVVQHLKAEMKEMDTKLKTVLSHIQNPQANQLHA